MFSTTKNITLEDIIKINNKMVLNALIVYKIY